tara:strand:+ start:112 stop:543 length:432 start_codon:yes stop_codon:yes gene_type:complete
MPKAPASKVIIHRIEFQETERELLKSAMTAYSFRNATKGIFNLTSDMTTVMILAILLETFLPDRFVGVVRTIIDALAEPTGLGAVGRVTAMALGQAFEDYKSVREVAGGWTEGSGDWLGGLFDALSSVDAGGFNLRDWMNGNR